VTRVCVVMKAFAGGEPERTLPDTCI